MDTSALPARPGNDVGSVQYWDFMTETRRRRSTRIRALTLALGAAALAAGCGSSHRSAPATSDPSKAGRTTSTTVSPVAAAGSKLRSLLIKPPDGYAADTAAGTSGSISIAQAGGSKLAKGFQSGYLQTYTNATTGEAILVTIMKFDTGATAGAFFQATATHTLTVVAPKSKPFTEIPGAVELDGTKADRGYYEHGVVMDKGSYYASVVYATTNDGALPIEFYDWTKVQYLNLPKS